jgi:hypothetical protein
VTVVRGQVNQTAFGIKDVVVVDRRQVIDGYTPQFDIRRQVESPQQPVSIEQQPTAVGSPVGCLQ